MKQYETTMVWCGNTCYDTVGHKGKRFFAEDTHMCVEEVPYPFSLSRVDHSERVNYVLYSVKPLIWSENDDLFMLKNE